MSTFSCAKTLRGLKFVALVTAVLLPLAPAALPAATFTWDSSGATPGSPVDGSGNWNTSSALWTNDGVTDVVWNNPSNNVAVFGNNGTAGTVTLTAPITANGLTFNSVSSGDYTIAGASTLTLAGTTPTITINAGNPTISAVIAGTAGMTLAGGTSTLTLSGANTYTGGTIINSGTIQVNSGGTLGATSGALTLGTALGTNATGLVLNTNVTVASLTVLTTTATNTISVANGTTFTIPTGTATNIVIGNGTTAATRNLTMSGTGNFTASGTTMNLWNGTSQGGTVILADGTNTFTYTTVNVSVSGSQNAAVGRLNLGGGSNIFHLAGGTLNLGAGKGAGVLQFNGSGGSLTIDGGAGAAPNIMIENETSGSPQGNGGNGSQMLLAGHSATITANTVTVGLMAGSTGGSAVCSVTFDTGTFTASNLQMARSTSGNRSMTSTFTLGGGNLNVSSTFYLSDNLNNNAGATTSGKFTMTGGTASISTDIIDHSNTTTNSHTTELDLRGGTLNMNGKQIGTAAAPITTVNLVDTGGTATLQNLGGTGINGAGLTMNGNGTLILGNNTYTGDTSLNNGIVRLTTANSVQNSAINPAGSGALVFDPSIGTFNAGGLNGNSGSINLADSGSAAITLQLKNAGGDFSGTLTGTGGALTMAGTNGSTVQILRGANSYTGATTINSGTLKLGGGGQLYALPSGPGTVTVSGGTLASTTGDGTINGSVIMTNTAGSTIAPDAGTTLNMTSLTMNSGGTNATLKFNLSGSTIGLINVANAASLNGGKLQFTATSAAGGDYPILNAGTLSNSLSLAQQVFNGTIFAPHIVGNTLKVLVTPASNLIWVGGANGNAWNVNSTANWNNTTTLVNPSVFKNFDTVTFDDSSSQSPVNISAAVQPSSVNFNNNSQNYVFNSSNGNGIGESGLGTTLTLNGSGSVTLNTANTYTGNTTVNSGVLTIGSTGSITSPNVSISNGGAFTVNAGGTIPTTVTLTNNGTVNFPASRTIGTLNGTDPTAVLHQTTGNLTINAGGSYAGGIADAGGLTVAGTTPFILRGNSTYTGGTIINNGATLQVGTASDSSNINTPLGNASIAVTNNGTLSFASSQQVAVPNVITGNAIQQNGTGTTTLTGANTYVGTTAVNNGTLAVGTGGTLGAVTNALTIGAVNGGTTVGTLNVSNNTTVASISVTTNTTSANNINIDSGKTLSSGAFSLAFAPTGGSNTNTNLNVSGAGTFNVTSTTNGNFIVGVGGADNTVGGRPIVALDMSQLANFVFSTGTGYFSTGYQVTRSNSTVTLANTSNSITAATLGVGDSGQAAGADNNNGSNTPSTLFLGDSTNSIQANSIVIGATKSAGVIDWHSSTGSVSITGETGGASTTNITIGRANAGGTNTGSISSLKLAGHSATVQAGTVQVGILSGATSGGRTDDNATVTFDTGTFNASSLQISTDSSGTATFGTKGSFTLGTAATDTGVLNVSNQFLLGNVTNTDPGLRNDTAKFIINGGTANIQSDITTNKVAAATGTTLTSTLTVAGGTLNMNGKAIGSYASPITTVNFSGGTLSNMAVVAGKTINLTPGSVTNAGAPTYVLANSGALNLSGSLLLTSGGGLEGGGTSTSVGTIANGDVEAGSGSHIAPGNGASTVGTLLFNNNLTLDGGSTVALKLSPSTTNGNDLISVSQNLTLSGTINLAIGLAGTGPVVGNTYTLFSYGPTLTGNETNFTVINPGIRSTLSVVPIASSPAGLIQLAVTGAGPVALTWKGNVNAKWNVNTDQNWLNPAPDKFFQEDTVTFDDTSTNLSDVQLVGQLQPGNVTVSATRNYKFVPDSVGSAITGGTDLNKSGSGMLTLATNNTYAGTTHIDGGTLQVGDGATVGSLGSGLVTNNSTLVFNRSDAITVSNVINGTGLVRNDGAGTTTLAAANGFGGGLTVNAGAVRLGNATAAGTGTIAVNGATLVYGALATNAVTMNNATVGMTLSMAQTGNLTATGSSTIRLADPQNLPVVSPTDSFDYTLTGTLHGSGSISVLSSGQDTSADGGNGFRLRGTGASDFSGTLTIGNNVKGELQSTTAGNFSPLGTGKIVLTAGAADLNNTLTEPVSGGYSELNLKNNTGDSTSANIVFGNNLEVAGTGLAVLNPLGSATPANTFTITLGNLKIGNGQQLGSYLSADPSHTIVFQSVTLNGGNAQISPKINGFGAAAAVGSDIQLGPISELVAGSSITMNGLRTLILDGNGTYTGGTTITSGTLQVGTSADTGPLTSPLGSGNVTNSAALKFASSQTVTVNNAISGTGTVTVNSGTVNLGGNNSGSSGGTTVNNSSVLIVKHVNALGTGGLAINNTATVQLQAGLSAPIQLSSLTITGGSSLPAELLGGSGDLGGSGATQQGSSLSGGAAAAPAIVQPVPEPNTLILAALGVAGVGFAAARRRKAR